MKRIEDIDPNFKLNGTVPADYLFLDPREAPFALFGLAPNDKGLYCRLPLDMLPACSEGVQELAWHLAGACVRFSTDSEGLAELWTLRGKGNMPHFAATGQSGMELFEETDRGARQIKTVIPQMDGGCGCLKNQTAFVPLPGGLRHYALYLPLYNGLEEFMLGFSPAAKSKPAARPASGSRWFSTAPPSRRAAAPARWARATAPSWPGGWTRRRSTSAFPATARARKTWRATSPPCP